MKEIMDIISAFDKAHAEGKKTALATVVHVKGSSYRKEGARMLITEDGELTGAISGGCLEGDALRKALFVMQEKKPKLVVYDTSDEDDVEIGFQLGCNGIIQVLIEPVNDILNHPISLLKETLTNSQDAILVTLFSLNREAEQIGTCLFLKKDGSTVQTINDKVLVAMLTADSKAALENDKSTIKNYRYNNTELTAFINIIRPQIALVIVGAGNDAMPLVRMGELLGWKVVVVDGRPNYANKKRFTGGCQVVVAKPENIFSNITINHQTMFVLMTHNYNYDLAMLRGLLVRQVRYIGILGSRGKISRMMEELRAEKTDVDSQLSKIYSPVGLDLGAESPEEIALSVIAEIQAILANGTGQHLGHQQTGTRLEAVKNIKEQV